MSIEKKDKIKKICFISSICLNFLFIFVLIFSAFNKKSHQKSETPSHDRDVVLVNNEEKRDLIIYDEDNMTITIGASELNSYVYPNLNNFFANSYHDDDNWDFLDDIQLYYNDVALGVFDNFIGLENDVCIIWKTDNINLSFSDEDELDNLWYLYLSDGSDVVQIPFDSSLDLIFDNLNIYNSFKDYLVLDGELNNNGFRLGIFEGLGSGIVAFVGTLSSGLNSVTSLFWYNNALTTFGLLSVIVVSVALSYFLLRFIIGLVRLRGN